METDSREKITHTTTGQQRDKRMKRGAGGLQMESVTLGKEGAVQVVPELVSEE